MYASTEFCRKKKNIFARKSYINIYSCSLLKVLLRTVIYLVYSIIWLIDKKNWQNILNNYSQGTCVELKIYIQKYICNKINHSCKTNEPSILFSMGCEGEKFKGENMPLKLEAGADLNS